VRRTGQGVVRGRGAPTRQWPAALSHRMVQTIAMLPSNAIHGDTRIGVARHGSAIPNGKHHGITKAPPGAAGSGRGTHRRLLDATDCTPIQTENPHRQSEPESRADACHPSAPPRSCRRTGPLFDSSATGRDVMSHLLTKARQRRVDALLRIRMPQINLFWDETGPPDSRSTTHVQLMDYRVRMGPRRAVLAPLTV